jgi:hypothetical protein
MLRGVIGDNGPEVSNRSVSVLSTSVCSVSVYSASMCSNEESMSWPLPFWSSRSSLAVSLTVLPRLESLPLRLLLPGTSEDLSLKARWIFSFLAARLMLSNSGIFFFRNLAGSLFCEASEDSKR